MKIINCAVVDDEPIAREGLKEFIDNIEFLKFKGFARDVATTRQLLENNEIDLIFLDINMPGMSGIDFMRQFTGKRPLFVFVTAYPDFAIESYHLESLDYLMKPVSFSRFRESAERALKTLNTALSNEPRKDFFFVKCEGKLEKINIPSIVYVSGLQNYVRIHLSDGRSHLVHSTLKNLFGQLDKNRFIMVHKSYIANIDFIHSISGNQIYLTGHGNIPIGRLFRPNIIPLLLNNQK